MRAAGQIESFRATDVESLVPRNPFEQQLLFGRLSNGCSRANAPLSHTRPAIYAIFERDDGNQGLEISVDTCGHRPEKFEPPKDRTKGFYPALIPLLKQLLNFF